MNRYLSPWVQFLKTEFQISTSIIFIKLSPFGQADPDDTNRSFDEILLGFSSQSMGPETSPAWPIPSLSLLEKGGAAVGHHPAIVPVRPTPALRAPSSHPPAPLPSSWAALAGEVHSPSSLPSGILMLPIERGYPETEDSFTIFLGPFSSPQSYSASACLSSGLAVPPPQPRLLLTHLLDVAAPPPEDCNPGM